MINFYPLTPTEQAAFNALTEAKTNNAPMLILTEPTDVSGAGVDADDLQSAEYSDYLGAITLDVGKIVVIDPVEIKAVRAAKSQKGREISDAHTAASDAGFDTGLGYSLSFAVEKRNTLSSFVTLMDHGVGRGSRQNNDSVTILDMDDVPRQITVSALIDLLTDYGEAYETLFNTHVTLQQALKAAQTVAAVNAITV